MDDLSARTTVPPTRPADHRRGQLTALIVACALFMENLDGTVIATALPSMGRAFHVLPTHMNLAMTSYLLSLAVFIPCSGWVADRFGTRPVFRAAIAIFTLASVLCSAANSLTFLVLARILQGLGGAMMVPVGRLLLLRTVPREELVSAMALVSMPALVGPVLGPPVGGFIVTYLSWRWIFDINVPIGILGIVLVTIFVEDVRETGVGKLDWLGLVLSGAALCTMMVVLETAGRGVVSPVVTWVCLAVSLGCGTAYYWHARARTQPLIDLSLLRVPSFMVTLTAGSLFRSGIGAMPFLLPMMLQLDFGLSAEQSGMITFIGAVGALAMKPATTKALRWFGFRNTVFYNSLISAVLMAAIAAFRPWWPVWVIYAVLFVGGVFRSLQFTAYNALAFADIPKARMSAASSFYAAIQQLSVSLGVSLAAASLAVTMGLGSRTEPVLYDFTVAFVVVAICSLVSAPLSLMMPSRTGDDISGHTSAAQRG